MKEGTKIIIVLAVISIMAFLFYSKMEHLKKELREEFKKEKNILVLQDSLDAVIARHKIDSLGERLKKFETDRVNDRNENFKLRKQNARLENLYRSIDVSSRPDF